MEHNGEDLTYDDALIEKDTRKLATTVTFLLNITQVGKYACLFASSLQFVDIPEGVTSINDSSFFQCRGLKVIKFPRSLRKIGFRAFRDCTGLERVDLEETGVVEMEKWAFANCSEIKSMTIPESLQAKGIGNRCFLRCSKLNPSNMDVTDNAVVIEYLRSQQTEPETK
ncbi:hypothetical protein TrVE_jg9978 [Triparma verrucosa]|uniref:Leucine-rich repeat domain-containing protein n=1 Tax=Triparma verrucosa TaxID=1606542 RepID=A0A9W7FC62_9STRA|nr:hypothetical protein TrVE_jg9978 [Triparma verrucosa]